MNSITNIIPKLILPATMRKLQLSPDEMSNLLDLIDAPSILVASEPEIIAVNDKAVKVTKYSKEELAGMALNNLFPNLIGGDDAVVAMLNTANRSFNSTLTTRKQKRIPMSVDVIPLDKGKSFTILTFQPIEHIQRAVTLKQQEAGRLETLARLSETFQLEGTEAQIKNILETGGQLVNASALVLYRVKNNLPNMEKSTCWGTNAANAVPVRIPNNDIQHFLKPTLWIKGERTIVTMMHQIAKSAGFGYMATTPVREKDGVIGVLVATGDFDPIEDIQQLLKLLASFIHTSIQHETLVQYLQSEIRNTEEGLKLGATIKSAARDGIIFISPASSIVEINQASEMIFGYANHEVIGQPIENILIGTSRLMPAIELAMQGVPTHNIGNITLHRRDGSAFSAHIQTVPATQGNQVFGVLILVQDESEQEQSRLRTQQLEQRAFLGEITAVFAHEVRNPINNISTGLQLMALNLQEDHANRELVDRLQQDCKRLSELMDSVLNFSRTGNYRFAPVDVDQLIERLLNRWRPRMARINVQHIVQVQGRIRPVMADQSSLEQVFTNLISNSLHAMEESGGTLAFKISTYVAPSGKSMIQIDVSDSGPGIPDEIRDRIFEPFFTTNPNGTGLGLPISQQIITAHKGSINLTSFPGGTVFHIRIPALEEEEEYII